MFLAIRHDDSRRIEGKHIPAKPHLTCAKISCYRKMTFVLKNRVGFLGHATRDRAVESAGVYLVAVDEDVISKIISVIQSLDGITPEIASKVTSQTNIVRDLNLDSIAVMEFIMELEVLFDTVIPLDTIAGIETVGDLARVLDPETARELQAQALH
jgi:acyl carrier protein